MTFLPTQVDIEEAFDDNSFDDDEDDDDDRW